MCTDFSFLGFLVVCSKKSRAQEMKWEANPLSSFEATRFKFRRRRRRMHGEEILIFSFFLLFLLMHHPQEASLSSNDPRKAQSH